MQNIILVTHNVGGGIDGTSVLMRDKLGTNIIVPMFDTKEYDVVASMCSLSTYAQHYYPNDEFVYMHVVRDTYGRVGVVVHDFRLTISNTSDVLDGI